MMKHADPNPDARPSRRRSTPAGRHRQRPTFEGLEARRLLSTVTWVGHGDGTSFADPANWMADEVPGAVDDAIINVQSGVTIQLPTGPIAINSLTQTGGALEMAGGSLTLPQAMTLTGVTMTITSGTITAGEFSLTGGTLNDQGGLINYNFSSQYRYINLDLINSTLNDGPGASSTIGGGLTIEGNSSINGAIPKAQTLSLSPTASNGSTIVTVPAGFINDGSITVGGPLFPPPSPPTTTLVVTGGGSFTNDGVINSGDNAYFAGQFFNVGSFNALSGVTALKAGSSLLNTGTLNEGYSIPGPTFDATAPGASLVNMPGGVMNAGTNESDAPCIIKTSSPSSFINEGSLNDNDNAPGELNVQGDFTQTATGTLGIRLEGPYLAGDDFDLLAVTGTAALAGALSIHYPNGYVPPNDSLSYQVITYGSATGNFSSYQNTMLSNGLAVLPIRAATSITLTTGPVPMADLAVHVAALAGQVTLGGNVTYTVTLANNGPDDAQDVALTDTLPSGASVVSVMASAGSPSTSNGIVTLDLDTFANAATDTLTIVVTPAKAGSYLNSASVNDVSPYDPDPANNQASASSKVVPPPSADLVAAVSVPPATTTGRLTFIASIYNAGPDPAIGSTLTDTFTLPPGAKLVGEYSSQGTVQVSGDAITNTIGTIPAGSTVTLTVAVVTTAAGPFTQSATAASSTPDPVLSNNTGSITATILGQDTLIFTPSANVVGLDKPLTLNAQVSVPPGFAPATKTVTFFDGSTPLGMATLDASGRASIVVPSLAKGVHSLSATYSGDANEAASTSTTAKVFVGVKVAGDFDGDGKADVAIYDATTSQFVILYSGGGSRFQPFGNPKDVNIPVSGDFDGDGKADLAIYDQTTSTFYVLESGGGTIIRGFGNPADVNIPVSGEFDGDGKADLGIYDQTASAFIVLESGGGSIIRGFGNSKDVNFPVSGDFDGDGKSDVGIYDQTASEFIILESGGGSIIRGFGNSKDVNFPVTGDFDGDGKADLGIYDQTASSFIVLESGGGTINQHFGSAADANIPLAVDLDGDGRTDLVIYDEALGEFFAQESGGGTLALPFGTKGHNNRPI